MGFSKGGALKVLLVFILAASQSAFGYTDFVFEKKLKTVVKYSKPFSTQFHKLIKNQDSRKSLAKLIVLLKAKNLKLKIQSPQKQNDKPHYDYKNRVISLSPNISMKINIGEIKAGCVSNDVLLFHEVIHALRHLEGHSVYFDKSPSEDELMVEEEIVMFQYENTYSLQNRVDRMGRQFVGPCPKLLF
jgi:hypothetical protein